MLPADDARCRSWSLSLRLPPQVEVGVGDSRWRSYFIEPVRHLVTGELTGSEEVLVDGREIERSFGRIRIECARLESAEPPVDVVHGLGSGLLVVSDDPAVRELHVAR